MTTSSMDRDPVTLDLSRAQARALELYGGPLPPVTSIEHVMFHARSLRGIMDSERRHVSIIGKGLEDTFARFFVETVCVLCEKKESVYDEVCQWLSEDVFGPKDVVYRGQFLEFGAVGVAIRLLDQTSALRTEKSSAAVIRRLAHVANYSAMAVMIIADMDQAS